MKKQDNDVCRFDANSEQNGLSDQELERVIEKAFGGRDPEAVSSIRYVLCAVRAIAVGFWLGWKKGFFESRRNEENEKSGKYAE